MKYFPILLSKAGEFKALHELNVPVKADTSPVIKILNGSIGTTEANLIRDWAFAGNQILLDFSCYGIIETANIADIRQLFDNLRIAGVNAVPVVQENSSLDYINLVNSLVAQHRYNVCIRASNDGGGLNNFIASNAGVMAQLGVTIGATILLIDLGYAERHNCNALSALAIALVNLIPTKDQWMSIVIASGSFPVDVSHLLPTNTLHRLTRFEWDIWNQINAVPHLKGIVNYGDYGNKNPVYGGDVGYAGSCSIKYTSVNEFLVYRGVLAREHPQGNGQYIIFSERLIHAPEYSGAGFSWGDLRIYQIAHETVGGPRSKPGNARTWVEITQNHHITLLHSLL
jgi:hypothetical protein